MWLFLAQEVLFFSGLFVAYGVYRSWHPEAFSAGSALLDREMGFTNTLGPALLQRDGGARGPVGPTGEERNTRGCTC